MRLVRSAGQNVSPSDDGRLYDQIFTDGLFTDTSFAMLGTNNVQVGAMYGDLCGRDFTIEQQTITVTLPEGAGEETGYIYVEIDTSAETPLSVGSALAPFTPTYEDINVNGAVAQMIVAEYTADAVAVVSITPVYKTVSAGGIGSLAEIETSPTKSSHAAGTYLVYDGKLYITLTSIAAGEVLTIGTNISATTAGDELSSLKNGLAYQLITNPTTATTLCKSGNTVRFYTRGVQPTANFLNTTIITDAQWRPKTEIWSPAVVRNNGVYQTAMARLTTSGQIIILDSGGNTITNTSTYDYCVFDFTYFI